MVPAWQRGCLLGTIGYMSPEQADLDQDKVDTRSDVHALSAVLYELLTGTTPFDRERLKTMNFDEVRRIIREEEPVKPSTIATATLADFASTIIGGVRRMGGPTEPSAYRPRAAESRQAANARRVEPDFSIHLIGQAHQRLEQSGLAGAVATKHSGDLTRGNVQADVVQDVAAVVEAVDMGERQHQEIPFEPR